ncbi:hypothetical protein L596_021373 [Steinernema carpocapsae]|uniref:Nematode cuticle collagen N-terminal domain-containing protein n=1 Tax=Steinernema carpocapsae TaxID=34508 RepID=A0A4U5MIK8_STECR|nr:hypothetical protein L596_021373 [Steinernema carpocapsae]
MCRTSGPSSTSRWFSFKVFTDDTWKSMVGLGAGTPFNRQRRRAYSAPPPPVTQCDCNPENKYPAGLSGPKGQKGPNGLAGVPGHDGKGRLDADNVTQARGQPGHLGRYGNPGHSGEMGLLGPPGNDGKQGTPVDKGPMPQSPSVVLEFAELLDLRDPKEPSERRAIIHPSERRVTMNPTERKARGGRAGSSCKPRKGRQLLSLPRTLTRR